MTLLCVTQLCQGQVSCACFWLYTQPFVNKKIHGCFAKNLWAQGTTCTRCVEEAFQLPSTVTPTTKNTVEPKMKDLLNENSSLFSDYCHLNLHICTFWHLSRDRNLHGSGTLHATTASPKPSFRTLWRAGCLPEVHLPGNINGEVSVKVILNKRGIFTWMVFHQAEVSKEGLHCSTCRKRNSMQDQAVFRHAESDHWKVCAFALVS